MTENAKLVNKSREDLILDAAADLLVRWGYRRVTIEDVAKQARIGKGTVYLHFRTKESLFLAVLLRSHHGVLAGMAERMEADPAEALPSRCVRSVYRTLLDDPVTRRLYLGDAELLGRLAHEAAIALSDLAARRDEVGLAWIGLLREAGLLRTDLAPDEQLYVFTAIGGGFFFLDGAPPAYGDFAPDRRADLLEHTLHCALEVPGAVPSAELAAAAAALFRSLIDHF
ncbi:helix-turn-helix domain-containing protein [Pseudonocardia ailaonensis]|uniref:TetR/AcrR family transcriptional regulator n=1 Tax=Pseudonocardia ailaonensis TaxID=367279 RepID=UPI0031DEF55C